MPLCWRSGSTSTGASARRVVEVDAPRQPLGTFLGCRWNGTIAEPQKRLGGTGTAENDLGDGSLPNRRIPPACAAKSLAAFTRFNGLVGR